MHLHGTSCCKFKNVSRQIIAEMIHSTQIFSATRKTRTANLKLFLGSVWCPWVLPNFANIRFIWWAFALNILNQEMEISVLTSLVKFRESKQMLLILQKFFQSSNSQNLNPNFKKLMPWTLLTKKMNIFDFGVRDPRDRGFEPSWICMLKILWRFLKSAMV